MPTNLLIGAFVLGGILLLIAVVGGRFKVFGAEISGEAGTGGRVFAGVVGAILVVGAFVFLVPRRPTPGPTPPVPSTPRCGDGPSPMQASNDCYNAYKAGDIQSAESICNKGLVKARCVGDHEVEGMILFNLGLCAEARSDWQTAVYLYESSLKVRSNSKVENALDRVKKRLQGT